MKCHNRNEMNILLTKTLFTYRINRLMLGKAHGCNTIDAYSQDSDE